jgi:hypothetical protein
MMGRIDVIENCGRLDHRLHELREMIIPIIPILSRMSIAPMDIRVDVMNGHSSHRQCMALSDDLTVVYPEYLMVMAITRQNQLPIGARMFAGCSMLNLQGRILVDTTWIWILHYPKVAITGIYCQAGTQEPINTGTAVQMFH